MATIADEIKQSFKEGSSLTKLIYINLGVFLVVKLLFVFYFLFSPSLGGIQSKGVYFQDNVLKFLMVPASLQVLLHRPWSLLSYMFLHFEFLHILFNVLWLYWFGRIFIKYLNERQLLSTYLLGGLAGAVLFMIFYNVFPGLKSDLNTAQALGASASVTAIVMAVSFYAPNHEVYLPFIGSVKIKYIAIFFVITDVLQIASDNAGGHIAHLGGAFYGYLFAMQLKRGRDTGNLFGKFMDTIASLFKPRKNMKVTYRKAASREDDLDFNKMKGERQKEVDRILDKIAKSGYDSLSKKEKETLFKMSNQS
jgi:membrane associated rhomboid family serine protease